MLISDWSSDVCSSDLITEKLRRGTEYSAPADDERWISGEIIGCQNNADHIEFDIEIDGLKSLTVGVAFGGFFSDHFEANPRSPTHYLRNLLGRKVDLLVTPDSSRLYYRLVALVPCGQKAMQHGEFKIGREE